MTSHQQKPNSLARALRRFLAEHMPLSRGKPGKRREARKAS